MRSQIHKSLDVMRIQPQGAPRTESGDKFGAFMTFAGDKFPGLRIISSGDGPGCGGWEHVSVSLVDRCPTWEEMCYVKDLFWSGSETVVQFHPKKSEYKNHHEFCLHLWKMSGAEFQLPPSDAV